MTNDEATKHLTICTVMIEAGNLAEALAYCEAQKVDPPQCSLTADSPNAHKLREIAKGMLSDQKWWIKRLKIKALRESEQIQIQAGKVTMGISDETFEYLSTKK